MLFGIEDELDTASVDRIGPGQVKIIISMRLREGPHPTCEVVGPRIKIVRCAR